jgi:uncharacterized protein YndB with AHSA1/START domain
VAEPSDSWVLDLTCTLAAAPERVFALLTDPTQLARWWGPHGFTTPEIEIDFRIGGHYRLGMQPPEGALFHLSGEYVEIDAPRHFRYTFRWDEPDPDDQETQADLSLEPLGEGTRLTLHQGTFKTHARLELHQAGWADAFEKLCDIAHPGRDE